jgi:sortase A
MISHQPMSPSPGPSAPLRHTRARGARQAALLVAERLFAAIGVACLAWVGVAATEASRFQEARSAEIREMLAASRSPEAPALVPETDEVLELGSLLGMLSVPRLGLETPVIVGDSPRTLDRAVGYLPDTAVPWRGGNTALAAHRDGLFRPLKDIREGDEIALSTAHGDLRYRVNALTIVDPEDLWVLEPQDRDLLTLITCFPFYYVGAAPQRFIVHAERVSE